MPLHATPPVCLSGCFVSIVQSCKQSTCFACIFADCFEVAYSVPQLELAVDYTLHCVLVGKPAAKLKDELRRIFVSVLCAFVHMASLRVGPLAVCQGAGGLAMWAGFFTPPVLDYSALRSSRA